MNLLTILLSALALVTSSCGYPGYWLLWLPVAVVTLITGYPGYWLLSALVSYYMVTMVTGCSSYLLAVWLPVSGLVTC